MKRSHLFPSCTFRCAPYCLIDEYAHRLGIIRDMSGNHRICRWHTRRVKRYYGEA